MNEKTDKRYCFKCRKITETIEGDCVICGLSKQKENK